MFLLKIVTDLNSLIVAGRLFHKRGATWMKERLAADLRVRILGTVRRVVSDAERRPVRVERYRERDDVKYVGAVPFRHLHNVHLYLEIHPLPDRQPV